MALLSAEDVLNKTFQATKFREGYDQDEVDDFLDEIVNTIRALEAENDGLKAKLAAAEGRIAELSRGGFAAAPEVPAAPVVVVSPEPAPEPEPVVVPAPTPFQPVQTPQAPVVPVMATPPGSAAGEPEAVTGMLALATKLHDEYIQDGKKEHERLVSDGNAKAAKIIKDAEDLSAATLAKLNQEQSLLERKIDELRIFERDYRTRLRTYLEGLIGDLENRSQGLPMPGGLPPTSHLP